MSGWKAFQPALGLAGAHRQSVLSSGPIRRALLRLRRPEFLDRAEEVVLICQDDVRLQGIYSAPTNPHGLVVLLHGWEGSAESTYMQDSASCLYQAGFAIFRLNFRDHGDTHHLNPGIFHSCRLDEIVSAVGQIAERYPDLPLLIAGFSLGGNFALRVAKAAPSAGIPLRHAFSVCPPISPRHSLEAIESAPWIYEHYFLNKWRSSLRRKQQLFPDRYQFEQWLQGDLLDTTARLVERFTEFNDVDAYFDGYSVAGDRLARLTVPTTIVASADDPVIPIRQFHELKLAADTELHITEHGGHCGFLENWRLQSWISRQMAYRLLQAVGVSARDSLGPNQPISETTG